MMERLGLDVIKVEVPWGEGVPEDKLAEILKGDSGKQIKAVTVVHNETTTGKVPPFCSQPKIPLPVSLGNCTADILSVRTSSFHTLRLSMH